MTAFLLLHLLGSYHRHTCYSQGKIVYLDVPDKDLTELSEILLQADAKVDYFLSMETNCIVTYIARSRVIQPSTCNHEITAIKPPYIKVEDFSEKFKPLIYQPKVWPVPNLDFHLFKVPLHVPVTLVSVEVLSSVRGKNDIVKTVTSGSSHYWMNTYVVRLIVALLKTLVISVILTTLFLSYLLGFW